jgi:hypothetical protein
MDATVTIRIDDIKWWVNEIKGLRIPQPLCPEHDLRLTPVKHKVQTAYGVPVTDNEGSRRLYCAEGPHIFELSREFRDEKKYVIDRIDAKIFKGMKVINLDDEALPIAKEKIASKDGKYFVTSQLMESKRGLQVVIYAGEKGKPAKTQIFVEPGVKRMAFDHKDLRPTDVFVKIEATFDDGSKQSIEQG